MTTPVRPDPAVHETQHHPNRLPLSVDLDHLDFVGDSGPGAFEPKQYSRRTLVRTAGVTAMVGVAATIVVRKYIYPEASPTAGAGTPKVAAVGAKPSSGNTGVPAGTVLTVYQGDMSVTAAGAVIQGLDIRGYVNIRASDVTIKNCVIRGPLVAPSSGSHAMVQQFNPVNTNLLVQDCTLVAQSPNNWTVGIQGSNYTMRRCNISYVVDGADASGLGNVLVDSCYIHDGAYFSPSSTNGDNQTHDDGAQISNGNNIVYSNNFITGFNMSCFMVGQDQGPIIGLKFLNNWLDGGTATINLATKNYPKLSVVITGNRFGRSLPTTYQILAYGADTTKISGNVWDDTGLPITVSGG